MMEVRHPILLGLPNISGVFGLTKIEIKKDFREIERFLQEDDTDSDSSVRSEDVLPSSYPVKPRKTPRFLNNRNPNSINQGNQGDELEDGNLSYDIKAADDAFLLLKTIKATKREIYDAEIERERLENLKLTYESSYENTMKELIQEKKEQENYFHLFQGLFIRALKCNDVTCKQNVMISEIIKALNIRNESIQEIETQIQNLKSLISSASSKSKKSNKSTSIETCVLKINLEKSKKEVYLYKSQYLMTPMGKGQIQSIFPSENKLVIKLSFGLMYANIRRAVCWCKKNGNLDLNSPQSLVDNWNLLEDNLIISGDQYENVKSLIDPLATDNELSDDETVDSSDESEKKDTDMSPGDEDNEGDDIFQALSIAADQTIKENEIGSCFPIEIKSDPNIKIKKSKRHLLRKKIVEECANIQIIHALPLAFVPPSALPYMIQRLSEKEIDPNTVVVSQQALFESGLTGTTGSLNWEGGLEEMRSVVKLLGNEINNLEKEQREYINQIESTRLKAAKLSQDTACKRVAMHSKRSQHFKNMQKFGYNNSGIVINGLANSINESSAKLVAELAEDESNNDPVLPIEDTMAVDVLSFMFGQDDDSSLINKKRSNDNRANDSDTNGDNDVDMDSIIENLANQRKDNGNNDDTEVGNTNEFQSAVTSQSVSPVTVKKKVKRTRRF